jgi:hypothetical protein
LSETPTEGILSQGEEKAKNFRKANCNSCAILRRPESSDEKLARVKLRERKREGAPYLPRG